MCALKFLLALAVSSLVLNDLARLAFPEVFQMVMARTSKSQDKQDDNNPTSTLFEEEVKHKAAKERFESISFDLPDELDPAIAHLITDEEVPHLAFLPIFSPPPNLA